jgi:serine/threonine protein phosphatase 1
VHANLEPGVPLYEQPPTLLRWTALDETLTPWDDGRRVICGHTSQRSHVPRVEAGWVCIDTACCRGGWLTALDVEADLVYQANDQRRTRQFSLRDAAAYATVETRAEQPLPQVPPTDAEGANADTPDTDTPDAEPSAESAPPA